MGTAHPQAVVLDAGAVIAFERGDAKATGIDQVLRLIAQVVERQEERSRTRRARRLTTMCQGVIRSVVPPCSIQPVRPFGRPGSITFSQRWPRRLATCASTGSVVRSPVIGRGARTDASRFTGLSSSLYIRPGEYHELTVVRAVTELLERNP